MGFNATIEDFKKLGLKEQEDGTWKRLDNMDLFKKQGFIMMESRIEDNRVLIHVNGKTEYIKPKYTFPIRPIPGLRMSSSDRWKTKDNPNPKYRQRPSVTRYFEFKNELKAECEKQGYELTDRINLLFMFKMPDSWSKKKRTAMINTPHKQKPDWDNCAKAFCDSLKAEDSYIWDGRAIKIWSDRDAIIVF